MGPPRPRSKRAAASVILDDDDNYSPASSRKKVAFKGEPTFFHEDDPLSDEEANGIQTIKRIKVSSSPAVKSMNGSSLEETTGFGPHVIKVMDEEMLSRVCQKYEKMGHSVQLKNNIIKLNVIKANTCLQEEILEKFQQQLEHCDMALVSSSGDEVQVHRFVLAVRSPVFKRLFGSQTASGEPVREVIDTSTDALKAMVKYLYTDTLQQADINEDLMTLADKYELTQMKELCLPYFVKKINTDNCLKAYIYGHLHNYEPLKTSAFHTLDENWAKYEKSSELIDMMKTHPKAALEILNRLHKKKSGFLLQSPSISLKMIKAFECLQEEIIKTYNEGLEFTDMVLVSSSGTEVPCHKFIMSTRSNDFRKMLEMQQSPPGEAMKIHVDANTEAVSALVKYLYTDAVDMSGITEDLIALSTKYSLTQLKDYCLPTFMDNISDANCLNMYVYGFKHNFDDVKDVAFKTLDENWNKYQNSSQFVDLMKTCPNAVLEIMSRLQKVNDCQPIVLENVKPRLVDF